MLADGPQVVAQPRARPPARAARLAAYAWRVAERRRCVESAVRAELVDLRQDLADPRARHVAHPQREDELVAPG